MSAASLVQKVVARACGRPGVEPGEIVTCRVDLAMLDDASGPHRLQPLLRSLGASIRDRDRVVLVIDHHVPEADEASRRIVRHARDWAAAHRLPHVYEAMGVGHVVVPQHGHVRPGMFGVGGDARVSTAGALGACMLAVDTADLLAAVALGEVWLQVPRTVFMRWSGLLNPGVGAKDMVLSMIGRFGPDGVDHQAVEFCGEAVRALDMAERMTLCNMSADLGAQVGLIAPDETTQAWLARHGVADIDLAAWHSDEDAAGTRHAFDASTLAPQVALPHGPAQVRAVDDLEPTPIDVAYIGACTGAKYEDLRAAARVLAGYQVAPGVRLLVAPASLRDAARAEAEGILRLLKEAGATLLPSACGACAGHGAVIPSGATVVSSTARVLDGRTGAAAAHVYIASPYTVAASALRGRLSDAREVLAEVA